MRATPPIPSALRSFTHPLYVNVYERLPGEPRLFGTETLYGDWDADVLLLAQDCGLVSALDERITQGHEAPHGHGETLRTNLNLQMLARALPQAKLYGSALGSLWRKSGGKSGKPPAWAQLLPTYVVPMLRWVCGQTRFGAVACLGEFAWDGFAAASGASGLIGQWRRMRDAHQTVDVAVAGRTVRMFAMYHPGARVSSDALASNWPKLAAFVSGQAAPLRTPRPKPPPAASGPAQGGTTSSATVYNLPPGARLVLPPARMTRPQDSEKSRSVRFRSPVLVELNRAGPRGLTEDQCGLIAYPADDAATRRRKQAPMIRNLARVDGHPLVLLPRKRVALARFFGPVALIPTS